MRVYSSDNQLIAEFGEKRREPVSLDQVPQQLIDAFLAAEDDGFEQHVGIDPMGLARAAFELVSTGSIQSGGSTITMQVARNYFLSREQTFIRKFKEILLALEIEQALSKDEILSLYLNKIYLGKRLRRCCRCPNLLQQIAGRADFSPSRHDCWLAQGALTLQPG